MNTRSRIFVAGHRGLLGSSLVRRLRAAGYAHVLTSPKGELDLRDASAVRSWFERQRPDYVLLAAARVGGIGANAALPAEFITANLLIQTSVFEAAYQTGVRRLLFFGSTCAYPKHATQPMRETDLLSGPLEPTSQPYAVAKLAGITMCEAYHRQYGVEFLAVIPATLYGPHDSFDPNGSHVIAGLIRRLHDAKTQGAASCAYWGSGTARREFLYVDDLADACLVLLSLTSRELHDAVEDTGWVLNAGAGRDIAIPELARLIQTVVGYEGDLIPDRSRPDGAPQKLLESSRIRALGWKPFVSLSEGLRRTYDWYLRNHAETSVTVR